MDTNLTFQYDRVADILYINKRPPYPEQKSEELGDEVVARGLRKMAQQILAHQESATRAYPSTVSLETVALLNHVEPGGRLEARRLAKQVVGGLPAWGGLRSEASPPRPE